MKVFRYILCLIVLTFVLSSCGDKKSNKHGDEKKKECSLLKAKDIESNEIEGRISKVVFPSGKTITLIGESHGHHEGVDLFVEALKDSDAKNNDWTSKLKEILDDSEEVLSNMEQNIRYLGKEIKSGSIQFIAIELPQEDVALDEKSSLNGQKLVQQKFSDRGIQNRDLQKRSEMFLSDDHWILKQTKPDLFDSVKIVGVDRLSPNIQNQREAEENLFEKIDKLDEYYDANPGFYDKYGEDFESIYMELRYGYDKKIEVDLVLKTKFEGKFPDEMNIVVKEILIALERHNSFDRGRDDVIVSNLLKEPGSGILTIGKSHLEKLGPRLLYKCEQM